MSVAGLRRRFSILALIGATSVGALTSGALTSGAQAAGSAILPGASSKDPYTVDAGKLDYFEKEQKLVYTGDVIATQGQTRIKGSTMTIYLEKSGAAGSTDRQVRRIEMKGPVTVVQNGKVGTGDAGLYDKTENKWYLIGNVTLAQGTDVTQGEKLIYDLTNATAVVDSGKQGRVKSVFVPKDSEKDTPKDAAPRDSASKDSAAKPPADPVRPKGKPAPRASDATASRP